MNNIEHLLDTIASNPLYIIIAISIFVLIIWSLIKKLYKLAIIFGICCLVYLVYIFIENPTQATKDIKNTVKKVVNEDPFEVKNKADEIIDKIPIDKLKNKADEIIDKMP
tara:strand:- start:331 stop:660 length:330 start_codon:yes stop_codon:yes gene_type:complete